MASPAYSQSPNSELKDIVYELKDSNYGDFAYANSTIATTTPIIERGQSFYIDVKFTSGSFGSHTYYNVWLENLGWYSPAALAVFDDKKVYVGNLLSYTGGQRIGVKPENWTYIPAGRSAGASILGRIPFGLRKMPSGKFYSPGTYYFQMIYNKSLVAKKPQHEAEVQDFYKNYDQSEYFRSNILKIEVIEKKSEK